MGIEHAPERSTPAVRKMILRTELLKIIPLSFPTIWEKMRRGEFPLAVKLGSGHTAKSAWYLDEIEDYQKSLPRVQVKPLTEAELANTSQQQAAPASP